jgi:hypothetical protein
MASAAAETTTALKSVATADGTGVPAFTPEQLQQLLIQLLPYNQMQEEESEETDEKVVEIITIITENVRSNEVMLHIYLKNILEIKQMIKLGLYPLTYNYSTIIPTNHRTDIRNKS